MTLLMYDLELVIWSSSPRCTPPGYVRTRLLSATVRVFPRSRSLTYVSREDLVLGGGGCDAFRLRSFYVQTTYPYFVTPKSFLRDPGVSERSESERDRVSLTLRLLKKRVLIR